MSHATEATRANARRFVPLIGAACFLAAAALIAAAARGSLWFDEVWSIGLVAKDTSPWAILHERFDNNHVLNTLYLWWLGPALPSDYPYRLLAVACGIASLATMGWIASRRDPVEGVWAIALGGSSYPLVLYWSEARGYAPAMLCGLLAFAALCARWTRLTPGRVALFWAALCLGVLAHLTFVIVTFAAGAAAVAHALRSPAAGWRRGARLAALFAPPLAFFAWFYAVFARGLYVIGGPIASYPGVLATTAAMLVGLPDTGAWRLVAGVLCLGIVLGGTIVAWRRRPEEGVFFLAILLVGPLGLLAATRPRYLYFRYFAVAFPFVVLALAALLGTAGRAWSRRGTLAAALVVFAWVAGHARRIDPLLRWGRGDTRGLLLYVATHSPPGDVRIGGDNETALLLQFYARRLLPDRRLEVVRPANWERARPEWMVTRSYRHDAWAPPEVERTPDLRYRRVMVSRHGASSGWTSFLWRREDATPP